MKAPKLGIDGLRANLAYARRDLCMAQANLWRARKWDYEPFEITHFERLVCAHLDHVWDCQEREMEGRP